MTHGTLSSAVLACALVLGAVTAAAQETRPLAAAAAPAVAPAAAPKAKAKTKAVKKAPGKTPSRPKLPPKSRDYSKMVELNSASRTQLMTLPGVDAATADRIIAARPFQGKAQIETRNLMPKGSYLALRDKFYVVPPALKPKP